MTTQAVSETGILAEAVIYSASRPGGSLVHWTGYISDRRAMRVVWNAGPPTVYGSHSEFPNIYTAEAFARDNTAGQTAARGDPKNASGTWLGSGQKRGLG